MINDKFSIINKQKTTEHDIVYSQAEMVCEK